MYSNSYTMCKTCCIYLLYESPPRSVLYHYHWHLLHTCAKISTSHVFSGDSCDASEAPSAFLYAA